MADAAHRVDDIVLVGTSHRSSTLSFREGLGLDDAALPGVIERLRASGCTEALILATPERLEILAVHDRPPEAVDRIRALLLERSGGGFEPSARFHAFRGAEAVRHLFHIGAGMESVVPGDPQAAIALRKAQETSRRHGVMGPTLAPLVTQALSAAERIGADTGLSARPASIAAAAVELARDIHGDLARVRALVLGAGEMGEILIEALFSAGLGEAVFTGRSATRLERIARRLRCPMVPLDSLDHALESADIVIASQGSSPATITAPRMEAVLKRRRRRPVFLIDAAIPGDIDRGVNDLDGAFLYDIGDLERFVMERGAARAEAARTAHERVDQAVAAFLHEASPAGATQGAAPKAELRERLEEMRQAALRDAGNDPAAATRLLVERLARELESGGRHDKES
ncbi:MAG: glutamyl-tRNA reductase [Alphaproteobacteria bacterium]